MIAVGCTMSTDFVSLSDGTKLKLTPQLDCAERSIGAIVHLFLVASNPGAGE